LDAETIDRRDLLKVVPMAGVLQVAGQSTAFNKLTREVTTEAL
jgi:hypothetical protein